MISVQLLNVLFKLTPLIGYVVISIQHDLGIDDDGPSFWKGRSCSRNAKVIDNLLYVFEWLKMHYETLFKGKVNLKRVGFIGHSFGGNSLLLWVNRTLHMFQKDTRLALLDRVDQSDVKECLILMEPTRFSFSLSNCYPLFFLLAEERESCLKETGCYEQMIRAGHKVQFYKGSTHVSFMDHGYVSPQNQVNPNEPYFRGSTEERVVFFDKIRKDIREFLARQLTDDRC